MKGNTTPDGYVDRGMLFPAYPTEEQVSKIESMQPSLQAAWNWLVSRIEEPLRAHEAMLVRRGLISPPIPRPDYSGLKPEEARARKLEYREACAKRRQDIFNHPEKPQWRPFLSGENSEAARLGMTQDYQVINNYLSHKELPPLSKTLLQKLLQNFNLSRQSQRRKKLKYSSQIMPMQVSSGPRLKLHVCAIHTDFHRRRCNAQVNLPGVGWIAVYLDPGLVNILMTPGNTVREGCTLKYEHGRWYASVKVIRREKMHPGPGDGSVCGIDPGLAKLATVSDGTVLPNKRNLLYAEARELCTGIADLHPDPEEKHWMREFVFRQDFRQRRRTLTQCRMLAAKLCNQYDFIGIEKNSGVALGIGSRYTGATKTLLNCLIHRCGTNRVREVDAPFNSQDCSSCGFRSKEIWKRKLGQQDQICQCSECGLRIDRDLNSALNVKKKLADQLYLEYSKSLPGQGTN